MNNGGNDDYLRGLLGSLIPNASNAPEPQPTLPFDGAGLLEYLTSTRNNQGVLASLNLKPATYLPAPTPVPTIMSKQLVKLLNPNRKEASLAQIQHSNEIETSVRSMLNTSLTVVKTNDIPKKDDIGLNNGKLVESAVLYIDIRNSTSITEKHNGEVAAKIYKVYAESMVTIARYQGRGHVRGFAGDKIMVVFDNHQDAVQRALDCAVYMQSFIEQKLSPALNATYNHPLECGVGIDYGKMVAVRGGIRNVNEIIWAGKPANVASKLADNAPGGAIDLTYRAMNRIKTLDNAKKNFNLGSAKTLLVKQGDKLVSTYRLANVRYSL